MRRHRGKSLLKDEINIPRVMHASLTDRDERSALQTRSSKTESFFFREKQITSIRWEYKRQR